MAVTDASLGDCHTALLPYCPEGQSRCVDDAVNDYLVDLTVPEADLVC